VRRAGREDLDEASVHLFCKGLGEVPVDPVELAGQAAEEPLPPLGEAGHMGLPLPL